MDQKAKIMIVEDERIIALETQYNLESMGYDVPAIVSSGEDAIKMAEELNPDLVLMDIILHGEMDGVEAAGQIRTRFDIPVVYITANVSDSRLEDITRSEPFGCVFKPFEDIELRAAVKMALYRHKMEKRLRDSEEKLKESEKMFRLITENIKDLVHMVDLNGNIQYTGPSLQGILGYEIEERIGRSSFEVVHPEDMENVKAIFANALATSSPAKAEYRLKHADGHYIWVEAIGNFICDDDGQTVGAILNIRDITEHKQAEEELRESEERYRTIIEGMEDGYYEVDLAGRFTFFNEAMRRILGFSADELMGMSNLEYTSPETAKKLYKTFNKTYHTGIPADVKDYEVIRKDGGTRTLEFNASLRRDENGEPAGFRGIVRDVTKRKEMENELEKRFQYLEGVLQAAPYAIAALDHNHQILRWNPGAEKLFGYSQEEVIGREHDSLVAVTADTLDNARGATKATMSGKALSPWETVRFRKDGSPVNVTASGSPIMVDGELIGVVAIYDDITARKQAEAEIKAHQEHLALINQILRHDITNDLAVIQSATNLYMRYPKEEFLKEIFSHAGKSLDLINRMRELESFISRHRKLQICKVRGTIDEVIKNYPSVKFEIKGKGYVMADDSLVSVIDNIVRNAVIHGKADRITITTGKERDMCEVRIADNGSGISDDIKEKVFEEGFMNGDTGHTGIGLHIVKKAMESYGGYAWVEDNEPRGAAFTLRFMMVK